MTRRRAVSQAARIPVRAPRGWKNPAWKPETIARHEREHAEERARSRADLLRRVRRIVEIEGPDSLYADMLADMLARYAAEDAAAERAPTAEVIS